MKHATATPDSTAVRTALWRALHLEVDAPPHVLDDRIGLQLAGPDSDWRQRPDMNEYATPGVRASIVARARFIEDLVTEQTDQGVGQYVLLGAGLDTFAQRRPEIASRITVFEVDQPGPQAWKRQRLVLRRVRRRRVWKVHMNCPRWIFRRREQLQNRCMFRARLRN